MSTHTYVVLDLSPAAFAEIETKLRAAGYEHAFDKEDGRTCLNKCMRSGVFARSKP